MTLRSNTFEGGTNGTAITTANSGGASGTAFNTVSTSGSALSTATYDTAQAAHGSLSLKFVFTSGESKAVVWSGYSPATKLAARMYLRLLALPTAAEQVLSINAVGGTSAARVLVQADGRLRVDDYGSTTQFTAPAGNQIAVGTWYRIELSIDQGTSTTTGSINFAAYALDSTTALTGNTFNTTTANTGGGSGNAISTAQFGRPGTSTDAGTLWIDDAAANDGTTTFVGVPVTNTPPTANAGVDQTGIEPAATVTLNGSGSSDPDGTIASYTWTQTAGSPTVTLAGTGATRTFTAPLTLAGTTLTFGLTVTDNLGASSTQDTMTVTVLPAAERIAIGGVWVPARISIL